MIHARHPLYSIPAYLPFLDVLASRLIEETRADPFSLASYKIFLPTRRACHALKNAFLKASLGQPLLLPTLLPLGDTEADAPLAADLSAPEIEQRASTCNVIPPLTRIGLLSQLIKTYNATLNENAQEKNESMAALIPLANQLAHFIDEVNRAELDFKHLDTLAPAAYAHHWQMTLDFLKIITHHWPLILQEKNYIESSAYRRNLLHHCAKHWQDIPPTTPIIAAGITHTAPAILELLKTIATLPQGRIIFAGLDPSLRPEDMTRVAVSHPHYHHATLLKALENAPQDIQEIAWPPSQAKDISENAKARAHFISKVFHPPPNFSAIANEIAPSALLEGWTTLDCESPTEEALIIAFIMRETLEYSERAAALVTPDRDLARRVIAELKRWNIEVDDSAGAPLSETPLGVFLLLLAECAAYPFDAIRLLSLLKHPFAAGGLKQVAFRSCAREFERLILRTDFPPVNMEEITAIFAQKMPRQNELSAWFASLLNVITTFRRNLASTSSSFYAMLKTHIDAAESMASTADMPGATLLWKNDAGKSAAEWLSTLLEQSDAFAAPSLANYPALLKELMATVIIRHSHNPQSRLFIWGAIESRLQKADRIILGAFNEQTWNSTSAPDPWLNRPMRAAFGLPPAEQTLGLVANDFAQAFCSSEVFITRSIRVNGAPTTPARWLIRLETALKASQLNVAKNHASCWHQWARALDQPHSLMPYTPPFPRPPVAARPRKLSVTNIATLLKDPYAIYASSILNLKPLKPLMAHPHAGHKGTLIHRALEKFARVASAELEKDSLATLLGIGRNVFAPLSHAPIVTGYWWPRFERIAEWFIAQELIRKPFINQRWTEVEGRLELSLPEGSFTLTAVADRIDIYKDGSLEIIDYKTGAVPSMKDIELGLAPQIPLEAAIALLGSFANISTFTTLRTPSFWHLTGGHPAGEIKPLKGDIYALANDAIKGITALLSAFDDPATPYCVPEGMAKRNALYNPYYHLERMHEWASYEENS